MIVTKLMKFNEVVLFNSTCCALLVLDLIVDMDGHLQANLFIFVTLWELITTSMRGFTQLCYMDMYASPHPYTDFT